MKKHIKTQIDIDASPSRIWNILMDFKDYSSWNPLILRITGNPKVGEQLAIHIQGMKFKPIVIKADAGKHFKWKGKLFTKGIFDGEHSFQLVKNENGTKLLFIAKTSQES